MKPITREGNPLLSGPSGAQPIEREKKKAQRRPLLLRRRPEEAKPSPIRFALDTLPGVIKEICKVYR